MLRHPLTHVGAGRYRTRTAAEATAACGGNREPRLGPRSDFSKPCQGAAEKSANATRTGASRQIPSRFPTPRNVYQERCRQTIRSGDFFRGGRYRTRTAAEATAACGGNREPRLGPRSDFSKPCQGAAEKSANATRTGASRQIPSRFPTPRNVYRDDRRFVVGGTGREP